MSSRTRNASPSSALTPRVTIDDQNGIDWDALEGFALQRWDDESESTVSDHV